MPKFTLTLTDDEKGMGIDCWFDPPARPGAPMEEHTLAQGWGKWIIVALKEEMTRRGKLQGFEVTQGTVEDEIVGHRILDEEGTKKFAEFLKTPGAAFET